MTTSAILIPVHQPPLQLADFVDSLREKLQASGLATPIWIVDDGLAANHAPLLDRLAALPGVHVVRHAIALGKGAALKSGINAILIHAGSINAIVTVDGDGQYAVGDVCKLAHRTQLDASRLYLGVRRAASGTRLTIRLGNGFMRGVMRILTGLHVSDAQSGLRALPLDLCEAALRIPLNGFEFETECLIEAGRLREGRLPIVEVPIQDARRESGRRPEFNPLLDSKWIYFVFLRYCAGSLVTFLTDYVVFAMVFVQTHRIGLGIALARCVAVFVSFFLNRAAVFHFRSAAGPAFARFVVLVVTLGWISYLATSYLAHASGMTPLAAKLLVESVLFFAGFALNNLFVFKRKASDDARTDWDDYYSRPYRTAGVTRRITTGLLIRLMHRFGAESSSRRPCLLELGGANSCFVAALRDAIEPVEYHIVDNNKTGLALSRERHPASEAVFVHEVDLLRDVVPLRADITFSVGLIEHFDEAGTARLIQEHFRATREGGIVLITFPTATWLYRLIRTISERLKLWIFFDERPLSEGEVLAAVGDRGELLYSRINWAIGLTQRVVAFRRKIGLAEAGQAKVVGSQSKTMPEASAQAQHVPADIESSVSADIPSMNDCSTR
jgi:putative flippase GtrA